MLGAGGGESIIMTEVTKDENFQKINQERIQGNGTKGPRLVLTVPVQNLQKNPKAFD